MKFLFCGDVEGNFNVLINRVNNINSSKNGPFDGLFCIGNFWNNDMECEEFDSIKNTIGFPIPIYAFVSNTNNVYIKEIDEGKELCHNLFIFKSYGFTTISDIEIVYVCSRISSSEAIKLVKDSPKKVDFVFTSFWPKNVLSNIPITPFTPIAICSEIDIVLHDIHPRYHFSSLNKIFYQRLAYGTPYSYYTRFISLGSIKNDPQYKYNTKYLHALSYIPLKTITSETLMKDIPPSVTASPYQVTVSNIISPIINNNNDNIPKINSTLNSNAEPFIPKNSSNENSTNTVDSEQLKQQTLPPPPPPQQQQQQQQQQQFQQQVLFRPTNIPPPNYTCKICGIKGHYINDCPQKNQKKFTPPDGYTCKICGVKGHFIKDCPKKSQSTLPQANIKPQSCWFCLANPAVEKQLIVDISSHSYLAYPKGLINDYHILIIPISHINSIISLPKEAENNINYYIQSISKYYQSLNLSLVTFERKVTSSKTMHAHIQCIGIPTDSIEQGISILKQIAEKNNYNFEQFPVETDLKEIVGERDYFYFHFFENGVLKYRFIHFMDGRGFNYNFGRDVYAAMCGHPELSDWKLCQSNVDEEKEKSMKFHNSLKSFL